jgi:hypothetical protein
MEKDKIQKVYEDFLKMRNERLDVCDGEKVGVDYVLSDGTIIERT